MNRRAFLLGCAAVPAAALLPQPGDVGTWATATPEQILDDIREMWVALSRYSGNGEAFVLVNRAQMVTTEFAEAWVDELADGPLRGPVRNPAAEDLVRFCA